MKKVLVGILLVAVGWAGGWISKDRSSPKELTADYQKDMPTEFRVVLVGPPEVNGGRKMTKVAIHWSTDSFSKKVHRDRTVFGDDVWITAEWPNGYTVTYFGTVKTE